MTGIWEHEGNVQNTSRSAEEPIYIIKLIKGVKLRSENWFTDSLNMSPSKFEPAAEKINENIMITQNLSRSLVDYCIHIKSSMTKRLLWAC